MERLLLTLLLLSEGPVLSACVPRQYIFVDQAMSWTKAQAYCRQTYTDLAIAGNSEEMNRLIDTVSSAAPSSGVWIGLYSENTFLWSDGFRGGDEYRKWRSYEPDWEEKELCVRTEKNIGWWDSPCMNRYRFICYAGTQLDPEFIAVQEPTTWLAAQSFCRENFTDLATVRDDQEHQEVQKLVPSGSSAWIGLFRPALVWSDGTEFSLSSWDGARPRGISCGAASLKESDNLDFQSCETRLPFVCYSHPVFRKVVKLRLRAAGSVDLNDPAVKADLLRKLQLRLKASGATLRWREQPDGRVFTEEADVRGDEL
ncbi:putative C-type lectin domain family 20 member A [Odontesthes bonariensis]|uniref:putative C-type lectin domain family 20 member A n=1 Tax=Odontesthes bonariensis TaxID=219752 RepID=UPI003F580C93